MAFEDTDMKDLILATLAEIEEVDNDDKKDGNIKQKSDIFKKEYIEKINDINNQPIKKNHDSSTVSKDKSNSIEIDNKTALKHHFNDNLLAENIHDDTKFLLSMKERLNVLFEGLKSKNGDDTKKLHMTISYLEYTLALLHEKLDNQ